MAMVSLPSAAMATGPLGYMEMANGEVKYSGRSKRLFVTRAVVFRLRSMAATPRCERSDALRFVRARNAGRLRDPGRSTALFLSDHKRWLHAVLRRPSRRTDSCDDRWQPDAELARRSCYPVRCAHRRGSGQEHPKGRAHSGWLRPCRTSATVGSGLVPAIFANRRTEVWPAMSEWPGVRREVCP